MNQEEYADLLAARGREAAGWALQLLDGNLDTAEEFFNMLNSCEPEDRQQILLQVVAVPTRFALQARVNAGNMATVKVALRGMWQG